MKHLNEEQLILAYYGELEEAERRETEAHLESCDTCRQALAALERDLGNLELEIPEPAVDYGAEMRRRVEAGSRFRGGNRVWTASRLTAVGAVAAALIAAFLLGRVTGPDPAAPAVNTPEAREQLMLTAVGDHLQRSQRLLLEWSHTDDPGQLESSRDLAAELADFNRLYRRTADAAGREPIADLLNELERILVEVANSPSELDPDSWNRLRQRINDRGLIFKIRVLEETVRREPGAPESAPGDEV